MRNEERMAMPRYFDRLSMRGRAAGAGDDGDFAF